VSKIGGAADDQQHSLIESGDHVDNHVPVFRKHYPWIRAQLACMEKDYTDKGNAKGKDLMAALLKAKLLHGLTLKKLNDWVVNRRKKDPDRAGAPQLLGDLKSTVMTMQRITRWKAKDDQRSLLLPLPRNSAYISTGDVVGGKNPRTTVGGTAFSFMIPVTSPAMMNGLRAANQETYCELDLGTFKDLLTKGFQVRKVSSSGFAEIDGIPSAIYGAVVLVLGTVTRNGHFRPIAYALASDESGENVRLFLQSVHLGAKKLLNDDARVLWLMGDMGPGIVKGVKDYASWMADINALKSCEEVKKADCFAHLMTDNMPDLRKSATSAEFYEEALEQVSKATEFPTSLFGRVWKAVKRQWLVLKDVHQEVRERAHYGPQRQYRHIRARLAQEQQRLGEPQLVIQELDSHGPPPQEPKATLACSSHTWLAGSVGRCDSGCIGFGQTTFRNVA
jgi:hypothetical protein